MGMEFIPASVVASWSPPSERDLIAQGAPSDAEEEAWITAQTDETLWEYVLRWRAGTFSSAKPVAS